MEHRAILGMGPCGNGADEITNSLYLTRTNLPCARSEWQLRGIEQRALVRHNLNILRMKALPVL
jgi:hypothetical protein